MQYYLDQNAHTNLNLTSEQLGLINNDIGIHGNPLSPNLIGRKALHIIENAREKIAELLGATDCSNIIFTNSCTEANQWACKILENDYYKSQEYMGDSFMIPSITISPYEHKSMDDAINGLPFMIKKDYVKLNNDADIIKINKNNYSIFIGVQNEIGIISNLKEVRDKTNNIMIVDMAQAVGKVPINLSKSSTVDIATFGAHKFGGPTGVGILYLRDPSIWYPLNNCKSYNLDVPGSMNVLGIWQTSLAMENIIKNMHNNMDRAFGFRFYLENRLNEIGFEIIGQKAARIPTTTLAKVPKDLGLELLLELEQYNIHIGLGSACGSVIKQPLKSVIALGYEDAINTQFIRISQDGRYDRSNANYVCESIEKSLRQLGA